MTEPQRKLHEGIGAVLAASAALSVALERAVVAVSGDDLLGLVMVDLTLGAQRDLLRKLVAGMDPGATGILSHPRITERERADLLELLGRAKSLVEYRNRVAHDEWQIYWEDDGSYSVMGGRATRISKSTTHTDLRSFQLLADQIVLLDIALGVVEDAVLAFQGGKGDHPAPHVYAAYVGRFRALDDAMSAGTLPGWNWRVEANPYHRMPVASNPRSPALPVQPPSLTGRP